MAKNIFHLSMTIVDMKTPILTKSYGVHPRSSWSACAFDRKTLNPKSECHQQLHGLSTLMPAKAPPEDLQPLFWQGLGI